jgi:40S ribosome biogenesis protein Tsr1 and BMS1 C-terminal
MCFCCVYTLLCHYDYTLMFNVMKFDDFLAAQKVVIREGEVVEKDQNEQLLMSNGPSKAAQAAAARTQQQSRSRANSMAAPAAAGAAAMELDDFDETASVTAFSETSKCVTVAGHEGYIASGTYVELVIADVPLAELQQLEVAPLLCFSLLQFEQKLSVLHFQVMRDARYTEPVPSKERLVVQCGFRKWAAKPVFSQINLNCDKHKVCTIT